MGYHYGWKRDRLDARDRLLTVSASVMAALPDKVDLRPQCPPVVDQGNLGSCTANAIGNAHRFAQKKQGSKADFLPSRLFIYYNERAMEGTIGIDAGAEIRDGIKSIALQGVCPETSWPYVISKFTTKPDTKCYAEALNYQALLYQKVPQTLDAMRGALAAGLPFVLGFSVYESFESDIVERTGQMPMPKLTEQLLGGHAVLVVGYDMVKKVFIVMNSWSTSWGDKGYFYMPMDFATNPDYAADFWTVQNVEIVDAPKPTPTPTPAPTPPANLRTVTIGNQVLYVDRTVPVNVGS